MTAYNLTTIRPKSFLHSSAFAEVKDSLAWALTALGHQANVTDNWIDSKDTNIIFGAELLAPNQPQALPPGTVIYNLEQSTHPNFAKVQAIVLHSKAILWDYSLSNIKKHQEAGIFAKHAPIGYTPNLTRIKGGSEKDISVLFLGWMTPRRVKVIDELRAEGLNVVTSDKCYGGGRDNLISRAEICLNVHHDGRSNFEVVRCSYLMANYKCVITENSDDDSEYADLDGGLLRCSYENIVATVKKYLNNPRPQYLAYEAITRRDYAATVKAALAEPSPQDKVAARYSLGSPDIGHYMQYLRDHAKGTILEIGVRDGASTSAFLSGLEQNGGVLLSVDIENCGHLFAGHPQWSFIQSSSQNPKLHTPELDVLFIDGDHTREGFRADLEKFYPLVKPGGLILCHDVAVDPLFTVEVTGQTDRPSRFMRNEFLSFAEQNHLKWEILPGFAGLGVMKKPIAVDSDESWEGSRAALAAQ